MPNTQRMKTKKESGSKAGTLAGLTLPLGSVNTGGGASKSSSLPTTATMQSGSGKIALNAVLQSKLDLVAGALADFQAAGGRVISRTELAALPSDRVIHGVKLYLVAGAEANYGIEKVQTVDGLEFHLVAEK